MSTEGVKEFEAELEKLSRTLSSGREKKIDLVEFMHECTVLFDKIDACLRDGDTREKDIVFRKLKEMNGHLESDLQGLSKECGKTEDEISAYIENPDNYTQDVWAAILKARKRILSERQRKSRKRPS
jgi:predicted Fe-S protein YdhL (DUF1289 family)